MTNGRKEAAEWLALARERSTSDDVTAEIGYVRKYAVRDRCCMACGFRNIGTSEGELRSLLLKGYKAAAAMWLRLARERVGREKVDSEIGYIYEYIAKANCTLADIGTCEGELNMMLMRWDKTQVCCHCPCCCPRIVNCHPCCYAWCHHQG